MTPLPAPARRALLAAFLALSAFVLAACDRQPEPPLRIGTNVWIGSEPLYLARELGYLDPAVVQLVEYPSASEVLRAYRNQAIDGMVISLDELFGLAVDGLQPRIILVVDVSHGADVVVGRPGMKSMQDLKGKSVAVPTGQSQTAMIPILFKANGLAESDVNLVNMPGNAMIASLLQKQVDAMLGSLDNYDLIFRQRGVDIVSLPFADHGVATVSTSIIASDAALAQKGDVVRKFIQASLEGWDAAIKRPDDAIKALVATFPTDTEPPRNLGELKAAISLMWPSATRPCQPRRTVCSAM